MQEKEANLNFRKQELCKKLIVHWSVYEVKHQSRIQANESQVEWDGLQAIDEYKLGKYFA